MRRGLLLATLASTLGHTLSAQSNTSAPVGSRIRFRALLEAGYLGKRLEGTVLRVSGDTLLVLPVQQQLDTQSVLVDRDAELFVSVGRRKDIGRGAAIGTVAGVVTAGLLGAFSEESCSNRVAAPFCADPKSLAVKRALLLGGAGAIAGAVIGTFASHEIWKRSHLEARAEATLSFGPRGGSVGLSFDF